MKINAKSTQQLVAPLLASFPRRQKQSPLKLRQPPLQALMAVLKTGLSGNSCIVIKWRDCFWLFGRASLTLIVFITRSLITGPNHPPPAPKELNSHHPLS